MSSCLLAIHECARSQLDYLARACGADNLPPYADPPPTLNDSDADAERTAATQYAQRHTLLYHGDITLLVRGDRSASRRAAARKRDCFAAPRSRTGIAH